MNRKINREKQFAALICLVVISCAAFIISSERALRLEHTSFYDYANPVYIVNVIVAFVSAITGGYTLLMLYDFAVENLKLFKENIDKKRET